MDRKQDAWRAVAYALRRGHLKKEPCADCGALCVEAHHEDYSKPLEVVWLCRRCHIWRHTGPPKALYPRKIRLSDAHSRKVDRWAEAFGGNRSAALRAIIAAAPAIRPAPV